MTSADWVFDGVLACGLPVLAWRVVVTGERPKAVVLFIGFGLVSALAWARLQAPDIALVEAAVGAGLTGALLVNTLGWLRPRQHPPELASPRRWLFALVLFALVCTTAAAILGSRAHPGLTTAVYEALPESGVGHPVTAVLLNFRGYDTLLEIAVLVVAGIAVQSSAPRTISSEADRLGPLLGVLVRLLVPGIILVAGYLLARGANAPGGAFQAGAVLGGGGILLILSRTMRRPNAASLPVRVSLVLGLAWFVAAAAAPLLGGRSLLEYAPGSAKIVIVSIELVLTLSIALVLLTFFPGEAPSNEHAQAQPEDRS